MAWNLQTKDKTTAQIPHNGSASQKIGNKTALIWSIPGTSGKPVDIKLTCNENKNNTVQVEIRRGPSAQSARKVKSFQKKLNFTKNIRLSAETGMVHIIVYQVKSGGFFGGFFEKFAPGMPGVRGRYNVSARVRTGGGTQPDATEDYDPGPEPNPQPDAGNGYVPFGLSATCYDKAETGVKNFLNDPTHSSRYDRGKTIVFGLTGPFNDLQLRRSYGSGNAYAQAVAEIMSYSCRTGRLKNVHWVGWAGLADKASKSEIMAKLNADGYDTSPGAPTDPGQSEPADEIWDGIADQIDDYFEDKEEKFEEEHETTQPETTYASDEGIINWIEGHSTIVIGAILAVTLIIKD